MMKNDGNNVIRNQKLSWYSYLKKINNIDSFKTRYFHYLRWRSVLQYMNFILNGAKPDAKTALDIGCNRGYYSAKLGDLGLKVDAVDLNVDLDRIMSNPNVTYFEENFLNWAPPRKYDLIMAFEVYEHILPAEREVFIRKIVSVLNPGGVLLFSGPNCFSFHYGGGYVKYNVKKLFGNIVEIDWHYRIPYRYYNHIFASQGFEIIDWHTNGIFPVLSNRLEKLFKVLPAQSVINLDLLLSGLLRGFGANYFAILKKGDMCDR